MAFPVTLALPPLNHLLAGNAWARERLAPHAGLAFRIDGAPVPVQLAVTEEGLLAASGPRDEPAVTITLGDGLVGDLIADPQRAFAAARLSGSAAFAEALAFVFRNLRWDFEADLATLVGDIPAHRIARLATGAATAQRRALAGLGANVAEFITEEGHFVTPARELRDFSAAVDQLRDDLGRLEKRIAYLSR